MIEHRVWEMFVSIQKISFSIMKLS